ncbi:MAG: ribosome silencing factor [Defluviitaleaceae bacterium]|nr:ribosome silencing factor [Defluviitaleaceae bacterium]
MEKDKILAGAKAAYKAVDDKQGEEIMVLDITGISPLADYFVIASANNSNQLKAMAEFVEEKLAPMGIRTRHVEGTQSARWILMDFGCIIVHLFHKEEREFYRLEKLWGDARHLMEEELV